MTEAEDVATLRRLRSTAMRQREATQRLHEAIREAAEQGMSYRRIASVVGLSYSRIHQIVRRG
jgi:DNA-directed RNA polymerase specialized sigma24 family protein